MCLFQTRKEITIDYKGHSWDVVILKEGKRNYAIYGYRDSILKFRSKSLRMKSKHYLRRLVKSICYLEDHWE